MTKKQHSAREDFSRALAAWREEKGYASGWAFFHQNGGKKVFDFSYNTYIRIESGLRLPSPRNLETILGLLGSRHGYKEERRALLVLFVKALTDGNPLFDPV